MGKHTGITIRYKSTYQSFMDAKKRCRGAKPRDVKYYVDRGIQFKFASFQEFLDEIGPKPDGLSLDRINNDGNYEKGNVRWATCLQQAHNKRNPNWIDYSRFYSEC